MDTALRPVWCKCLLTTSAVWTTTQAGSQAYDQCEGTDRKCGQAFKLTLSTRSSSASRSLPTIVALSVGIHILVSTRGSRRGHEWKDNPRYTRISIQDLWTCMTIDMLNNYCSFRSLFSGLVPAPARALCWLSRRHQRRVNRQSPTLLKHTFQLVWWTPKGKPAGDARKCFTSDRSMNKPWL